jgi:hypothetical protein
MELNNARLTLETRLLIGLAFLSLALGVLYALRPQPRRRAVPVGWEDISTNQIAAIELAPILRESARYMTIREVVIVTNGTSDVPNLFWREMHESRNVCVFIPGGHFSGYGNVRLTYTLVDGRQMAFRLNIGFPQRLLTCSWMPNPRTDTLYGPPILAGVRLPTDVERTSASREMFQALTNLLVVRNVSWIGDSNESQAKPITYGCD